MSQFEPDGGESGDEDGNGAEDDAQNASKPIRGIRIGVGVQPLNDLLGSLLDVQADRGDREPPTDGFAEAEEVDRRTSTRGAEASAADYLVETTRTEDGLLVVADLPGVDEDDLQVGLDLSGSQLVIVVEGRVVERVNLPWDGVEATKTQFNNGVLEILLRPADDADDADDDDSAADERPRG